MFKNLDVCFLSSAPIVDSTLDIQSCSLAIVTGVSRDTYFQRRFRIQMSKRKDFIQESLSLLVFFINTRLNMETSSVISRHDEKNDTSIQAILKDCIGTLIKDFLYLNQKVLICLPTEACLPDFLVDIEEIFGCSDSDTISDVVVLHNVRSIESCSKIQKALLEN